MIDHLPLVLRSQFEISQQIQSQILLIQSLAGVLE